MASTILISAIPTVTMNGIAYGPRMALVFNGSPTAFQNGNATRIMVLLSGGTLSLIEFSRDNVTFDAIGGLLSGAFYLNPGDWLRITYIVAPSGVYYPV